MPLQPDPARPDWLTLVDHRGRRVGTFLRAERDGRPMADLFELSTPLDAAVPAILRELGGWRIAGDEALGRALVAAGGVPRRHAHVYTHDLRDLPPAPVGFRLAPLDRPAEELAPVLDAAFPPDHPDLVGRERQDPLTEVRELLIDERFGPLLPSSGVALDEAGRVVAAIIVTDAPGEVPLSGPWVMLVFRDPAHPGHPGSGRALLVRALQIAARDGLPALGLAVTDGNPAIRLYEALGWRRLLSSISVDL
jgi:GNAT superfamily N-acetyltransferase